jgi:uncharacterized protein (TIGR02246 family)
MQRFLGAAAAISLLFTTVIASAQVAETGMEGARQQIHKLLTAMEESFNHGDAKGLAECWTPGGDFVGRSGARIEGRDAIEKAFRESLAARKNSKLQLHVLSLRIASGGLALVDAIAETSPPAPAQGGEPSFSLVLVRRGDRWLIESARETISPAPSSVEHMKGLEWMVGDWAGEVPGQSGVWLRSTCGWTESRAFLIRKFKLEGKDGVLHAGTEVIGWDPRAGRIRSWVFNSNGGFGENLWVRDGNRWLLSYSGTLADGSDVSATNILVPLDADTVTLQSKDRTANGQRQPDVPEITIKRQVAAKDAAGTAAQKKPPERILP